MPPPRTFSCPTGTAQIYDHGAHVVAWQPAGAEPVLWLSARSQFEEGAAIRGGIPVCFPWFGPGRSGEANPPHGFARLVPWHFLGASEAGAEVIASYELGSAEVESAQFPYEFVARLDVGVGANLRLSLTLTNTGDVDFSYEEALHTYLAVGDSREVVIDGLDGATYLDKGPGGGPGRRQDGPVRFVGETDRVYHSTAEVRLTDPVLERTLTVTKSGSANTVVWNPWVTKSAAMSDFGDDEWTGMACIEAGNVLADAVSLSPGESHTLTYLLGVS